MTTGTLDGEIALVTGGAVRVGAAICRALSEAGAAVAIHCHNHLDEGQALADELAGLGRAADVFQYDLTEAGAARVLFDRVESALGPVTLLVNNAGLIGETPLRAYDEGRARLLLTLNVEIPLLMMAEMARRRPPRGSIINVADSHATRAWRDHSAYVASKSALLAASRVAAHELAPTIRVNVVNPGTVALRDEELPRLDALLERIPLNRIGEPAEIGRAVLFLATTPYATGAVLDVDGGTRLR